MWLNALQPGSPAMEIVGEARNHVAALLMDDELQVAPDGLSLGLVQRGTCLGDKLVDLPVEDIWSRCPALPSCGSWHT